jgi:hypothetical protein
VSRRTFVRIEIGFLLTILAWITATNCAGIPDPFTTVFMLAYFYLVVGWSLFLARVLPQVAVDWWSFGLAGACLTGLVVGLHLFCVWLHREITMRKASPEPFAEQALPSIWRLRTTLSMIGLVVCLFVAGIAAVGGVHQLVWLRTRP